MARVVACLVPIHHLYHYWFITNFTQLTKFSKIWIKMQSFFVKKRQLKVSSANYHPFHLSLNELDCTLCSVVVNNRAICEVIEYINKLLYIFVCLCPCPILNDIYKWNVICQPLMAPLTWYPDIIASPSCTFPGLSVARALVGWAARCLLSL